MNAQADIRVHDDQVSVTAVVFEKPETVSVRHLELMPPGDGEVLVNVEWSGISTGTEKLLWSGSMPPFPGLGYPLVPGYETVGRIAAVGPGCTRKVGERVFISGASCYGEIRGLFGGAASKMVVSENKVMPVTEELGEQAILMALAATAYHALMIGGEGWLPDLVVGHGVVGRLLARLAIALGGDAPTVWETQAARSDAGGLYTVVHPDKDTRSDYRRVVDASGDAAIIDKLMPHSARNVDIVLAGFYSEPVAFAFPPAFMREASIRIAAEWQPSDLEGVKSLVESGAMSFDGLITHQHQASEAEAAYPVAFSDPACLKMILDWRS